MKVVTVFGTRPEAIKMFPAVHALRDHAGMDVRVCVTAQHREMLDPVLDFRESPAVEVAAALARRFGTQIRIVEPFARELPRQFDGTGAALIDLDSALASCDLLIVLVDHELFKSIRLEERREMVVYNTGGLWPTSSSFMRCRVRDEWLEPEFGRRPASRRVLLT